MKNNKKTKNSSNKKPSIKTTKMVMSIAKGDNVKAYNLLEQIVKEKVAKKIDDALAQ